MKSSEFRATSHMHVDEQESNFEERGKIVAEKHQRSQQLLLFSLNFDPYSPTAEEDYEKLKEGIKRFDVFDLLKRELGKSRVHTALAKKIVAAIRYLDSEIRRDSVLSIVNNSDVLYPIFSSALIMLHNIFEDLDDSTQCKVVKRIVELIRSESHVLKIDILLCFALRVLQHKNTEDNRQLLTKLYREKKSEIIRRDIILIMTSWKEWHFISDLRNKFRSLSAPEKRAFIFASYSLYDEGSHWRDSIKKKFDPFEQFICKWASERANKNKRGLML